MFQKVEKDGCIFQISQPLMLAYFIMKKFKQHGYSNFTFARNYFKQTLILQQGTESPHCCSICISSWSKIVHSCAECPHIVAPYVFPVGLRSYIAVQNVPTLLLHMCFQLVWDHTFLCRMSPHCCSICVSSWSEIIHCCAECPHIVAPYVFPVDLRSYISVQNVHTLFHHMYFQWAWAPTEARSIPPSPR